MKTIKFNSLGHCMVALFLLINFGCATISGWKIQRMDRNDKLYARKDNTYLKRKANAEYEASQLTKAGWKAFEGSPPLWKLVFLSNEKSEEEGKYLFADGNGVGETKASSEAKALEQGKRQLAGNMSSNIIAAIKGNIATAQLSPTEAASIDKIIETSSNSYVTTIGIIRPDFKIYRVLTDKNTVETQVRIFYPLKEAVNAAKSIIRDELKAELKLTDEKVEKILGGK